MPRECGSRPRAILVAIVAAGACTSTLPAPAGAEDGAPPPTVTVPSVPAPPDVDGAIDQAVAEAISAVAEDANEIDEAGAAVESSMEQVGQPDAASGSAAPPASDVDPPTSSVTAPGAPDPASAETSPADTTVDSGDTVGDSAAPAEARIEDEPPAETPVAEAPAPQPPASQAGQLNVNLTVRASSPGSNGDVTQLNVAATPAPGHATADTTRSEQAALPIAARPVAPPRADDAEAAWYWQWDCVSAPDIEAIPSTISGTGSIPSSWTWIWNCGGNSSQYQPETTTQYQQINANISIRIDSPGDDGAVTQANVAVSVPAGGGIAIPSIGVTLPPILVNTSLAVTIPAITSSNPTSAVAGKLDAILALPAVTVALEGDADPEATIEEAVLAFDASLERSVDSVVVTAPAASVGNAIRPVGFPLPWAPPIHDAPSGIVGRAGWPVGASSAAWSGGPHIVGTAGRTTARQKLSESTPAPTWKPARDVRPTGGAAPGSGATATAPGPGSSSGIGLPIFLALLLFAAVLDLARRVAFDRVTLPSGHWRRPPDTPG